MDHLTLLLRDRLRLRGTGQPPSRRLAAAVHDLVEAGALAPGARLPSERELAPAVGMSRGTVASAYRSLVASGLCERRHGSGTYLTGLPATDSDGALGYLMRPDARLIDLSKSAVPDPSHLHLPPLDPAELLRAPSQHGYEPQGDPRLRSLLRERVRGGDFLITNGAQQAIDLAARCVIHAGDTVLVEETTYLGALAVIRRRGARPVPVAGDEHGPDPAAFQAAIARHRPSCAYLVGVHNPTGRVTTPDRIDAIAALARAAELVLIDDRTLAEIVYDRGEPPPYAGVHPEGTVTVESLSKTVWGGLRVGWISAPPPLLARLAELRVENDLAPSTVSQRMAAVLLEHNTVEEWRDELRRRRDHLCAGLGRELPEWTWQRPAGGLSLWLRLPGTDAGRFADLSRGEGVAVAPGVVFSPEHRHRDHLRLSFALTPELLDRAVAGLARAWDGRHAEPSGAGSRLNVTL